jgi:putative spermidine/putrescine transport system ATP-binding protein
VLAEDAEADNVIEGTIAAWSYFGASFSLLVDTRPAGRLQVAVPAWRCPVEPTEGRTVRLGWSADASVPVQDD